MNHRRGLKVNLFPSPSSSRSEGTFQGYQLGSAAGREAMRGRGAWGAGPAMPTGHRDVLTLLPDSGLGEGTAQSHGHRNSEGRPNLPGGGSWRAKKRQGPVQPVLPVGSQHRRWGPGPVVHDAVQMPSRHNLESFASCPSFCAAANQLSSGGSSAEPSWLAGCERRRLLQLPCFDVVNVTS